MYAFSLSQKKIIYHQWVPLPNQGKLFFLVTCKQLKLSPFWSEKKSIGQLIPILSASYSYLKEISWKKYEKKLDCEIEGKPKHRASKLRLESLVPGWQLVLNFVRKEYIHSKLKSQTKKLSDWFILGDQALWSLF